MRLATYERQRLEEIVEHCLRTNGVGSIDIPIYRLPFLGNALSGLKRRAAEESLFSLPPSDPFFGYGELAQLTWRTVIPPEPDFTMLPFEESRRQYQHWSRTILGSLQVYWAEEIYPTIAMHLFRATAHHIEIPEGKYNVFHSEKWRLKKKTATPATRARLEYIYVRQWIEDGVSVGVKCGPLTAPEIKLASSLDTL